MCRRLWLCVIVARPAQVVWRPCQIGLQPGVFSKTVVRRLQQDVRQLGTTRHGCNTIGADSRRSQKVLPRFCDGSEPVLGRIAPIAHGSQPFQAGCETTAHGCAPPWHGLRRLSQDQPRWCQGRAPIVRRMCDAYKTPRIPCHNFI